MSNFASRRFRILPIANSKFYQSQMSQFTNRKFQILPIANFKFRKSHILNFTIPKFQISQIAYFRFVGLQFVVLQVHGWWIFGTTFGDKWSSVWWVREFAIGRFANRTLNESRNCVSDGHFNCDLSVYASVVYGSMNLVLVHLGNYDWWIWIMQLVMYPLAQLVGFPNCSWWASQLHFVDSPAVLCYFANCAVCEFVIL